MKANLIEEIVRIKQMMALNEEPVDLSTYDSADDIIENMEVVEMLPNGNVLINFDLRVFIPETQYSKKGFKYTLRVPTEFNRGKRIVDTKRISLVDAEPNNKDIEMYWHILVAQIKNDLFKPGMWYEKLMIGIYAPYFVHASEMNLAIKNVVTQTMISNKEKLLELLTSAFSNSVEEPTMDEPDNVDVEIPQKGGNGLWTSTNSWKTN